jgi:HK97 gp10 family phage protein
VAGQKKVAVDFNAAEFEAGLKKALDGVKVRGEGGLLKVGTLIQNAARGYCPVDTGRLRSSIQRSDVQSDDKGAFIDVGTNVTYAPHVEFGTAAQQPQPYLRPAFLDGVNGYAALMKGKGS